MSTCTCLAMAMAMVNAETSWQTMLSRLAACVSVWISVQADIADSL